MSNDYIAVTCISSYRMRYVMHKDDLRKLNIDVEPTDKDLVDWALDTVTLEECEEFSQEWLGETIVDHFECTEEEMLGFFDRDNAYLSSWPKEQKTSKVRNSVRSGRE